MRRPWSPIVGAVGFDGGSKRAISFVLRPKEEEDDPIPETEPPTLVTSLLCDTISASKTKCGGPPFDSSTPPRYFKRMDVDTTCDATSVTKHSTSIYPSKFVPCTPLECLCEGVNEPFGGCGFGVPSDNCSGYFNSSCFTGVETNSHTATLWTRTWTNGANVTTRVWSLSEEVLTSELIDETTAALPAYDNDFNDGCGASKNLSPDESSYTVARFRYKIRLASPAPFDVLVSWDERLTPEVGSPSDAPFSEVILEGSQETTVHTRNEPASDGTYTIVNITAIENP